MTFSAVAAIAFLFVGVAPTAVSQPSINESNWIEHPRVREIRHIVNAIEDRIAEGHFDTVRAEQPYDQPYVDTLRVASVDRSGVIRKLVTAGGSDDSVLRFTYYYDHVGRLRFVFITGGAVNGTLIGHRIYLDTEAQKLWEMQTLLEGPGYTFPRVWPLDRLVFDPATVSFDSW
jgi:hypothetical protein